MQTDARQVLYQKKGVTISKVASSLLSRNCGDRIPPISYYEKEYGVSRGNSSERVSVFKRDESCAAGISWPSGNLYRTD